MSDDLTADFTDAHGGVPTEQSSPRPAPLELNYSNYMNDMREFDLTEEQEREFLDILWSIMRSFVELGFGSDICVQLLESFNEAANELPVDVE